MTKLVLTVNAGSSSLKFAAYRVTADGPLLDVSGQVEGFGGQPRLHVKQAGGEKTSRDLPASTTHESALVSVLGGIEAHRPGHGVAGIGHRVVHGGMAYSGPILVGESEVEALRALSPLAPLHQPHNVAGIEAARSAFPGIPQVACFDTAFHRGHPFVEDTFALPRRFYEEGVRRYGFHGLSYEFILRRLRQLDPARAEGRVVCAHLGNGASMCGIRGGRPFASTMGFTALDGLPMGTRCGQLDPGVVLYLLQHKGMSPDEVMRLLYNESGLKGLSGLSGDMRTLEAAGTPEAEQAIAYFVERIRRELGGLAAVMGGLDTVIFTGGIGENAAGIRMRVAEGLAFAGLTLDAAANAVHATTISAPGSAIAVMVIPTDEESMIARHTMAVAGITP